MRILTRLLHVVLVLLILCISSNRELSAVMFEKKIPHEFRQLPGEHSWPYWDRQVQEILKIASQKMRLPRAKTSKGTRA